MSKSLKLYWGLLNIVTRSMLVRTSIIFLLVLSAMGIASLSVGCDKADDAIAVANRAANSIDAAIAELKKGNQTFGEMKDVLENTKTNLDKGEYKNQLDDLIGRTGQMAQLSYAGSVDFTRSRVIDDLENIKRLILRQPLLPRVPILATTESPRIDFQSASRSTLTIVGWNLDVAQKDPAKYKITVSNRRQQSRQLARDYITFQGQYALTINTSQSGGSLQFDDTKLVFEGFDPAFEIAVINSTRPPIVIQPPVTHYVLIFVDHEHRDELWQVNQTNIAVNEPMNQAIFKQWCTRFTLDHKKIVEQRDAAGDEHFKGPANWWTQPPYNLNLPMNERWFQIMDDERWYVFGFQDL